MKGNLETKIRQMLQQIEELQERGPGQEPLAAVRDGLRKCLEDLKATEKEIAKMIKAVETTPTAIALISLDGQIEYANPGLLKSGGFCDAQEVLGRSVFDYTDEEGRVKLEDEIIPALFSGGQWHGELALRRKDGKSYIAEMICAMVKDDSGEPSYFLANFYDITDRKCAEESLLLDDFRLEALLKLNQMDEASLREIADFALEAGVKLTNSKLGYLAFVDEDEKTLTMHSWFKRAMQECHIDHKKTVYSLEETGLWGEALRQRQAVITNDYSVSPTRRGTPQGHVKIFRHMNVPIMDKGKIVVVAGVGNKQDEYDNADVRQLTLLMSEMWKLIQRRKTEEALKESQRALSTLMSNLPGMAYRSKNDRLRTMEFVSDGCQELTGYRSDDLIQNRAISYAQIIHPDDLDYIWNGVHEAVAEKRPYRLIYRIRSPSGTKWVWEQGQGIFSAQGELVALEGFVNDITERKLAEEALKRTHEELEKRVQERTAGFGGQ